jgi:hypothetical protein
MFASCELDENMEIVNPKATEFTLEIQDYLSKIPLKETEGALFTVDVLKDNIDYQSIEAVVINKAQTLLIATLGNITNNNQITSTKIVFYLHKNGIKKAKVFTFEDSASLTSYNNTIKYMLSNENDKITYSGRISIYSENGLFQFNGTLDNGKLLKNEKVYPKFQSSYSKFKAEGERCLSWYRVVKVDEVIISITYLYTTCQGSGDSASGGNGSSGSSTGPWVILPDDPDDKTLHTHIDENGLITEYIYEKAKQIWHIIQVTIPEVVVYTYPKYQFLGNIYFPSHGQIVIGGQYSYQYNTYTGSWIEKPIEIVEYNCVGLKKQITAISKDEKFTSAVSDITAASVDGFEHSITLGIGSDGKINQAPMNNGTSQYQVQVNKTWPGAFAAIHNHPNGTQMSAGDIYAAVTLNTSKPNFTTTYLLLPDGSMYALVVTDLVAATAFVNTYPADINPPYSPEFPDFIFNQLQALVTQMGSSVQGRTEAIAFLLDKYNAGMKLLKQDANEDFNPIQIEETIQNGTKIYTPKPCN